MKHTLLTVSLLSLIAAPTFAEEDEYKVLRQNEENPNIWEYFLNEQAEALKAAADSVAETAGEIAEVRNDTIFIVKQWNDVEWKLKNQGDIDFSWIEGTGNPVVDFSFEVIESNSDGTMKARQQNAGYYEEDGSKGFPKSGLYYEFAAAKSGVLKIGVWANKGNRLTYVIEEGTMTPIRYFVEGFVNGETEWTGEYEYEKDPETGEIIMEDGQPKIKLNNQDEPTKIMQKKFLTYAQLDSLNHKEVIAYEIALADYNARKDAGKLEEGEEAPKVPSQLENPRNPYIIGAGNQASWVYLYVNVEAGKKYMLFQHSSQIGFNGFSFTEREAITEEEVNTHTRANAALDGTEVYNAVVKVEDKDARAPEFAAAVDENGKATNPVVEFGTASISVKATGGKVADTDNIYAAVPVEPETPASIKNTEADAVSTVYYDLQGRKVARPLKGQLYINGGKLVPGKF